MLVENQIIEVKATCKTLRHYRALGYNPKLFDIISVKSEHLTNGSHYKVDVICDYCKGAFSKTYKSYLNQKGITKTDACVKCRSIKTKDLLNLQYGVDNVFQIEKYQQKHKSTVLNRYGVEYISQVPYVREKVKKTNIERLGVDNPFKSKSCREKAKKTCLNKYGVANPSQSVKLKAKAMSSLTKHGNAKTSLQQRNLHNSIKSLYSNVELNYPLSRCLLDIALFVNDIKIDIEYDGWYWHQDKHKDRKRDEYLKSKGWKILRIKSGHKLPTPEQLIDSIDKLLYTDRNYTEIRLEDWRDVSYEQLPNTSNA
jgi:Uncharacterized protein conserved in bacteria